MVPRISKKRKIDCFLLQNPPAMPLLAVVHVYCLLQGTFSQNRPKMIIDWHNLGFSMLSHPTLSKVAKIYERLMAPCAQAHLCVTSAMKQFLKEEFRVPDKQISVLYDCPAEMFQSIPLSNQHQFLSRLHKQLCAVCPKAWYSHLNPSKQTLFTEIDSSGLCVPRLGRPALITSSTSWTADEDFGILLEAAVGLDRIISERNASLRVVMVVTGKGPQKLYYEHLISQLRLTSVVIQTLWLEPADYPKLIACADLGVSLHTSTSGIDLPMKVLDLFGCCVPVVALNFQCLSELVEDDKNGRVFDTSTDLTEHLWNLLQPLDSLSHRYAPHSFGDLHRYSLALTGRQRWDVNWRENASSLIAT